MAALGALPIVLIAEPLTGLHRRGHFLPGYSHDDYDRVINLIVGPLLTAGVIVSIGLAAKWFDHRPIAEFGVRLDRAWWSQMALGFGLGAGLMALAFASQSVLGWVRPTGTLVANVAGTPIGLALFYSCVKVLCVGTYEEFVSRGYHLRNLMEGLGPRWGIVVSSSIFALLHLTNENASALSILGLFVNGLLFATAVLVTGRLSAAIGLHIAWNLFEGAVFGFPVSGDKERASLMGIEQSGPAIVTGGSFGPEAGLIGVLASLVGITVLLMGARRRNGGDESAKKKRATASHPGD